MEWKSKEKCKFKRKMKFYNISSRAQSLPVKMKTTHMVPLSEHRKRRKNKDIFGMIPKVPVASLAKYFTPTCSNCLNWEGQQIQACPFVCTQLPATYSYQLTESGDLSLQQQTGPPWSYLNSFEIMYISVLQTTEEKRIVQQFHYVSHYPVLNLV